MYRLSPSAVAASSLVAVALLGWPAIAPAQTCVAEEPALTNGTLSIGVAQGYGGVISAVVPLARCLNLIDTGRRNNPDRTGREIQVALRRGEEAPNPPGCFACNPGCKDVWNPTQGGNCAQQGTPVDVLTQSSSELYVETGYLKNFDTEDGDSRVRLRQTVEFVRSNVVRIKYVIINEEPTPFRRIQEFPVVFVKPNLLLDSTTFG
jgi:hypothetical protein